MLNEIISTDIKEFSKWNISELENAFDVVSVGVNKLFKDLEVLEDNLGVEYSESKSREIIENENVIFQQVLDIHPLKEKTDNVELNKEIEKHNKISFLAFKIEYLSKLQEAKESLQKISV
jgi:DNA-dependent RNA polymerase auxiliary subunit epsilon